MNYEMEVETIVDSKLANSRIRNKRALAEMAVINVRFCEPVERRDLLHMWTHVCSLMTVKCARRTDSGLLIETYAYPTRQSLDEIVPVLDWWATCKLTASV